MKTISVIIPAYNAEKNIGETLESLLGQTDLNFEIVVIDDGSADNTYNLVKVILEDSGFADYKIISQENQGVSAARNQGIEEATKDYLLFLDSDDYIAKNTIEILKESIHSYEAEVIAWGYNTVMRNAAVIWQYSDKYKLVPRDKSGISALNEIVSEGTLFIWTGSAIYNREFILRNKIKFSVNCYAGEDLEFIYKSLAHAAKFVFIDKVLSFYVQTQGSVMNTYNVRRFDAVFAMKRTAEYLRENIEMGDSDLADDVENQSLTKYRYRFSEAYKQLEIKKDIFNFRKLKFIMEDIESNYPGLNRDMRLKLLKSRNKGMKELVLNKTFAISPLIYFNLLYFKHRKASDFS